MRRDNKRKRQRDKLLPGLLPVHRASLPRVHSATYAMITVFMTGSWSAAGKFTDSFSDVQQITRGGRCTHARFIAACFVIIPYTARKSPICFY